MEERKPIEESQISKKILVEISRLPTLPSTFSRINELVRRDTTTAIEMGEVISRDQTMALRLLKMVNSAYYGFTGRIKTVSHAVVVLGFKAIRNLALSCSVFDLFKEEKENPYFNLVSFWEHSLSVAYASRLIGKICHYPDPEELFVTGLLHDLGKLVHHQYLSDEFRKTLEWASKNRSDVFHAEAYLMGTTHCETGYAIAKKWNLAESLRDALAYHHHPEKSDKYPMITSIVHIADIIARALRLGDPGDKVIPKISTTAWNVVDLENKEIEKLMRQLMVEHREITYFLDSVEIGA